MLLPKFWELTLKSTPGQVGSQLNSKYWIRRGMFTRVKRASLPPSRGGGESERL